MGAGIAQVAAQSGFVVRLYDISDEIVSRGVGRIEGYWVRGVEKGRMTEAEMTAAMECLCPTSTLNDLADSDLVIEAAPEEMELKQQLFGEMDIRCRPDALFATNTSSLSVTAIADSTRNPARLAGMHFFNPAPLMPLVEVIRGESTPREVATTLMDLARAMGKTPVMAADTPGFIVNRVARPYYSEALKLVGDGIAEAAEVDGVMERAGFRMGPFTLMDLIGIDVNLAVTRTVFEASGGEARYRPHPIQEEMVERGTLGRKTGSGFYEYEEEKKLPDPVGPARPAGSGHPGNAEDEILPRMLAMLVNEAAFALGEGVASPEDINTAMRLGTNWPIGPLEWGERIGLKEVLVSLENLQTATGDDRYRAAPLLVRLVDEDADTFPDVPY